VNAGRRAMLGSASLVPIAANAQRGVAQTSTLGARAMSSLALAMRGATLVSAALALVLVAWAAATATISAESARPWRPLTSSHSWQAAKSRVCAKMSPHHAHAPQIATRISAAHARIVAVAAIGAVLKTTPHARPTRTRASVSKRAHRSSAALVQIAALARSGAGQPTTRSASPTRTRVSAGMRVILSCARLAPIAENVHLGAAQTSTPGARSMSSLALVMPSATLASAVLARLLVAGAAAVAMHSVGAAQRRPRTLYTSEPQA